ncbi:MAG: ADP-glyceromanno-heptose 6-epimerase [Chthoniobacterales bacterium]
MSDPLWDIYDRMMAALQKRMPPSWRHRFFSRRIRHVSLHEKPKASLEVREVEEVHELYTPIPISSLPPKRETEKERASTLPGAPTTGNVLVTGGAGFIGSAVIEALNQKGIERILVADFLGTDSKWKNLNALKVDDVVCADHFLNEIKRHPDHFGKFSAVFHLGACSATTEANASYLLENNYAYTKSLCRWALAGKSRFVYASSAATYGDGSQGMKDQGTNLHDFRPLNMYGYSKHLFDLWARRQGILDRIVGLKYFNVFGPNEYHKGDMRSLVCKAYEQIVSTGKIKLFKSYNPEYKDGEQVRDFVYIKDAVAMTMHLATTPEAGGLYNIGTGKPRTWLDLANAIFTALDREPEIEFIDMPENIRGQYQYHTSANIARLRDTGYKKPAMKLEESIRDYVKNYLFPGKYLGD